MTGMFLRVMLANFGYFLSLGMLNPVLPRFIKGPLGSTGLGVGIGLGSFTVTALLMRTYSGRLGDRRGRRLPITLGAVIHAGAVAGLLLATSLPHVVILRMITGVGEALFFVGASTAIQDLAPDDRRGEAASLFSLSLFAGLALGPQVSEPLLDALGYHAVWWAATGAAIFGALVAFTVQDTRPDGIGQGSTKLVSRAALRPGLVLGCAIWGLAAFNSIMPLYALQIGLSGSRLVFLTNTVVIFLFRSLGARLPDRLGAIRAARLSLACTPAGLAVMGLWSAPAGLFVGAVLLAMGQSMAFPALMTIAVNSAPASERGSVMGTFTSFFDLAFGVGLLTLGAVSDAVGYGGTFLVAMGVASLGLVQLVVAPPRVPKTIVLPTPVLVVEPPAE